MGLCELSADERKVDLIDYPQMNANFIAGFICANLRHLRTGLISRRWTPMDADERKLHCWFYLR